MTARSRKSLKGKPKPKRSQRSRRKPAKAAVIAVLTIAGTAALGALVQYYVPKVADKGIASVQAQGKSKLKSSISVLSQEFYYHGGIKDLGNPPSNGCLSDDYRTWVYQHGAVDTYNRIVFTVTSQTNADVLFQGIELHVSDRKSPGRGVVLNCSAGGPPPRSHGVRITVGKAFTRIKYLLDSSGGDELDHIVVKLVKDEPELFDITVTAQDQEVSWMAVAVFSIDGAQTRVPIKNDGGYFKVTAERLGATRYEWDGTSWRGQ